MKQSRAVDSGWNDLVSTGGWTGQAKREKLIPAQITSQPILPSDCAVGSSVKLHAKSRSPNDYQALRSSSFIYEDLKLACCCFRPDSASSSACSQLTRPLPPSRPLLGPAILAAITRNGGPTLLVFPLNILQFRSDLFFWHSSMSHRILPQDLRFALSPRDSFVALTIEKCGVLHMEGRSERMKTRPQASRPVNHQSG